MVSVVAFDSHTGAVLKNVRSTEIAMPLRIVLFRDAFHLGLIGGNLTNALWARLGVTPDMLFFTGLLMWWNVCFGCT